MAHCKRLLYNCVTDNPCTCVCDACVDVKSIRFRRLRDEYRGAGAAMPCAGPPIEPPLPTRAWRYKRVLIKIERDESERAQYSHSKSHDAMSELVDWGVQGWEAIGVGVAYEISHNRSARIELGSYVYLKKAVLELCKHSSQDWTLSEGATRYTCRACESE